VVRWCVKPQSGLLGYVSEMRDEQNEKEIKNWGRDPSFVLMVNNAVSKAVINSKNTRRGVRGEKQEGGTGQGG